MIKHLPYSDQLNTVPIAQIDLATTEIPIYLGRPMLPAPHKTRIERPRRFAKLRDRGSEAYQIAFGAAMFAGGVLCWAQGWHL